MVTYQLKEKVEGKESSVQVVIANIFSDNKRLKLGIGISIKPEEFGLKGILDRNTNTLKDNFIYKKDFLNKSKKPTAIKLKTRISIIEACIHETRSSFEKKGVVPSSDEFRVQFDKFRIAKGILATNKVKINTEVQIINKTIVSEFFNYYIEDCELRLKNNTPIVKLDTVKKYKSIYHHWLNFEQYKKKQYVISELTEDVVVDFIETCIKIKNGKIVIKINHILNNKRTRDEDGYSKQTIDNIIDMFLGLVNKAAAEGIRNQINLRSPKLKVMKIGRKKEYFIKEKTLSKIIESKPKTKLLQQARDYIIIASMTGMRFQSVRELNKINLEYIDVDGSKLPIVKNIAHKTDSVTYSTVFKPVLDIYSRNGNRFPKIYSLAYLNIGIRKLFKELKIKDKLTIYNTTYGSESTNYQDLAANHVSSHDCRSTFITNMLLFGVNREVVKSMTHQHNTGDAFSLYDKTSAYDKVKAFYCATCSLNSEVYTY